MWAVVRCSSSRSRLDEVAAASKMIVEMADVKDVKDGSKVRTRAVLRGTILPGFVSRSRAHSMVRRA